MSLRPLMTADEAAAFLRVPRRRVWAMSRKGEIPTIRIGVREVRFDEADLESWIARRKSWTPKGTRS
jgi:excisionase family DNA binding protein